MLNKTINFNKDETESEMENLTHFSSYKNRKLKVKL